MARGRKKQYINNWTSKDKNMLRAFRNCGRLTESHLKKDLAMANQRLTNFQRDGYIEKVWSRNPKTREMEAIYQLTETGRLAVQSKTNLTDCYRSGGDRHDLAVAEKYFSLSETEQLSWRTEGELQDAFKRLVEQSGDVQLLVAYQDREISTTDGAYVSDDGRLISFEVVTTNYGREEIQAKESFAKAVGMELELSKI